MIIYNVRLNYKDQIETFKIIETKIKVTSLCIKKNEHFYFFATYPSLQ